MLLKSWFFPVILLTILDYGLAMAQEAVKVNGLEREVSSPEQPVADGQEKLPWFFPPGVFRETDDQYDQFVELTRLDAAVQRSYQQTSDEYGFSVDGNSLVFDTGIKSTSRLDRKEVNCVLILDNYTRLKKGADAGKVRVTWLGGQRLITDAELDVVVKSAIHQLKEAIRYDYEFYQDHHDRRLAAFATTLKMTVDEVKANLNYNVDGSGVTWGRLNNLEPIPESRFVPVEYHIGFTPDYYGVLGLTLLNTGIVYYNPQAWLHDYLHGKPLILMHELVHNNGSLQSYPLTSGFDPELLAMIPEGLDPNNQFYMMFHGYFTVARRLGHIYTGFDFEEARRQIINDNLAGNFRISRQKYNELCAKIVLIQRRWSQFFKERALPEFYGHQHWFMAMNEKLQEPNGWLWIMMAKEFSPVILDDLQGKSAPGVETMKWLKANEPEIRRMAEAAYKKSGESSKDRDEMLAAVFFGRSGGDWLDIYNSSFSPQERELIEEYIEKNPQLIIRLRNGELLILEVAGMIQAITGRNVLKQLESKVSR